MATDSELAQLSSAAYQDNPANMQLPQGWSYLTNSPPDPSGYQGYAFARLDAAGNPVEIVIANRGTEITSAQDRAADLQMVANKVPDQYHFAKQFYRDVLAVSGDAPITVTGHSLGGTLSQLLAAESTQPGNPPLSATTFNPYGAKDLIPDLNSRYGLNIDPNATYNNITNHQSLLDGVSRLGSASAVGSDQLGQMHTHVAASELLAAALVVVAGVLRTNLVLGTAALEVQFGWSHSIDRFTQEIYPQEALAAQVGQAFKDFARTVADQINAIEQAGAEAQASLQNDFLQLLGAAGQTYQDAVNTTSSAIEQIASGLTAAEQSAAKAFLKLAFMFGDTIGIEQAIATAFTAAQRFSPRRDPLTLDLNNNGLETVPVNAAHPIYFDLEGSGVQTSVGWVAPSDGFLVLDRNGDGLINDGTELFGDATPAYEPGTVVPSAAGKTADGFAALAQEDTNLDGIVNAADANFVSLRVWQDVNQDGISFSDTNGNGVLDTGEDSELETLAELGIASFNVASINHSQLLADGNQIADTGTFTRTDGSTGTAGVTAGMGDVNLAVDTFHRTFADVIPLTAEAQALPDMQGSGVVRDLRQAASIQTAEGATLAGTLSQFAADPTRDGQRAQLDSLLTDWAATANVQDLSTQAGAHGYGYTTNLTPEWQHKLAILETFNGRSFFHMPWDSTNAQGGVTGMSITTDATGHQTIHIDMNGTQLALLDQAYSALKESVYDALIPQTRLKPYLDSISLALDANGTFRLDFTALDSSLAALHGRDPAAALVDLAELLRSGAGLGEAGWSGLGTLQGRAAAAASDTALQPALAQVGIQVGSGTLRGGFGKDFLFGGTGNDWLYGEQGDDTLAGGEGGIACTGAKAPTHSQVGRATTGSKAAPGATPMSSTAVKTG